MTPNLPVFRSQWTDMPGDGARLEGSLAVTDFLLPPDFTARDPDFGVDLIQTEVGADGHPSLVEVLDNVDALLADLMPLLGDRSYLSEDLALGALINAGDGALIDAGDIDPADIDAVVDLPWNPGARYEL